MERDYLRAALERKSGEEISPFVRDDQTGRFPFNARPLQALGIHPVQMRQRGYPLTQAPAVPEAARTDKRNQAARV